MAKLRSDLRAPPRAARDLTGSGRLPNPENLVDRTPEELVRTLNRFGIDPDLEGIEARGRRAMGKFDRLLEEGVMPDDALLEKLEQQNEREFTQNLRQMAKSAIRLYRNKRLEAAGASFMWVTSGRDNVCPSCEPRHGQVRTMPQWRRVGLPGSASLLCGAECNCQLVPAS